MFCRISQLKVDVLKVLTKSLKNNDYFIVKSCRQTKITYPAEAYLDPSQISIMTFFFEISNSFQWLTIFAEKLYIDSKCVQAKEYIFLRKILLLGVFECGNTTPNFFKGRTYFLEGVLI